MQNTTIQNNGNQYYQENNFYHSREPQYKVNDLVEGTNKVSSLSSAIWITIVGIVADLVTIASGLKQIDTHGFWEMLSTYKLHAYTMAAGIIFIAVYYLIRSIFKLLKNRTLGKYILKNNVIYKVKLKKCPICGSTCGGKLKIEIDDTGAKYVCHRDKAHAWRVEYRDIVKIIE